MEAKERGISINCACAGLTPSDITCCADSGINTTLLICALGIGKTELSRYLESIDHSPIVVVMESIPTRTGSLKEAFDNFTLKITDTAEMLNKLTIQLSVMEYDNRLELEERSGWNNPLKIGYPISAKTIYKNNMIRNRLRKNKLRFNEIAN